MHEQSERWQFTDCGLAREQRYPLRKYERDTETKGMRKTKQQARQS